MYSHVRAVEVFIWGRHVGTIAPKSGSHYRFEYDADFLNSGIELAPFELPLRPGEEELLVPAEGGRSLAVGARL